MDTNNQDPLAATDVVLQSGDVRSDIAIHYSKVATDVEIAALALEYRGLKIEGLADVEGYDKAKKAKNAMVRLRSAVESTRKGLKADVLVRGRTIDSEAKRIFTLIEPIEAPLTAELERIKAEQERIEQDKKDHAIAVFNGRMEQLAEIGAVVAPTIVAQMDDEEWVERYAQESEDFQKREAARKEAEAAEAEHRRVEAEAEAKRKAEAEAEAAKVRAESERLAKERAAFREEVRIATEKAEAEAKRVHLEAVETQKKIDADRAEVERQAAELEAKLVSPEALPADPTATMEAPTFQDGGEVDRPMDPPPGEAPSEIAPTRVPIEQLRLDALVKLAYDIRTFEITGHAQFARTEIQAVLHRAAAEIEALTSLIKES